MKFLHYLCCIIVFYGCKEKAETTKPQEQSITESVYASGKIKSRDQYDVFSPVSGIIKEVYVKEGDTVCKGDALISLINEVPKLNTENARIAATYQSIAANQDRLNEALQNIDFARAKLESDSLLLVRQQHLWANEIGTRHDLEQRELSLKNSRVALETAKLRYQQLKQQLRFSELQSQKALQISHTTADDYIVRANENGKVYHITRMPGETVNQQTAFAVVGAAGSFILELQVDEYDIAKIQLGQKAIISMDSYKGQVFEGTVISVDPIMNSQSRSVTVEASFIKQPPVLLPNLTVEANIIIRQKEKALTIPRNYLVEENYVVLGSGQKRRVKVGLKDYQKAEILEGLTATEIIRKPEE